MYKTGITNFDTICGGLGAGIHVIAGASPECVRIVLSQGLSKFTDMVFADDYNRNAICDTLNALTKHFENSPILSGSTILFIDVRELNSIYTDLSRQKLMLLNKAIECHNVTIVMCCLYEYSNVMKSKLIKCSTGALKQMAKNIIYCFPANENDFAIETEKNEKGVITQIIKNDNL